MIHFENVGIRYGTGPEVLKDVSLEIERGGFYYLTGASGAGKTTLLRMIFMKIMPTRGLVTVFDHETSYLSRADVRTLRRRIGVVLQDFNLLDHLSVYENVALPMQVRGYEESAYRADVVELLDWVGLKDRTHASPVTLSSGERQRASIARAVIAQPELLIADEPTGNLDSELAVRLLRLFVELNRSGTSILIATHDMGLLEQNSAAHIQIEDGYVSLYR